MGIEAAQAVLPKVPHCAIMDTAWHQTMPDFAYSYAVPREWQEKYAVRRYGFHGTSFLYNAKRAAVLLGKDPFKTNLIIAHIGNGASINAVKDGLSFDTSMGMTPLEGLVMGTRSGDIDPGIIFHMMRKAGLSAADVEKALNKQSGILGITGKWADRRDVEQAAEKGDKRRHPRPGDGGLPDQEVHRRLLAPPSAASTPWSSPPASARWAPRSAASPRPGLENIGIVVDEKKNELAKCRNAELDITGPGLQGQGLRHPDRRGARDDRGRLRPHGGHLRGAHQVPLLLPGPDLRQQGPRRGPRPRLGEEALS